MSDLENRRTHFFFSNYTRLQSCDPSVVAFTEVLFYLLLFALVIVAVCCMAYACYKW